MISDLKRYDTRLLQRCIFLFFFSLAVAIGQCVAADSEEDSLQESTISTEEEEEHLPYFSLQTFSLNCLDFINDEIFVTFRNDGMVKFLSTHGVFCQKHLNTQCVSLQSQMSGKNAALSPDKKTLAAFDRDKIFIWDMEPVAKLKAPALDVFERAVPLNTTVQEKIISITGMEVKSIAFSPDSQKIAALVRWGGDESVEHPETKSSSNKIIIWNCRTRQIYNIMENAYPQSTIQYSPDGKMLAIMAHTRLAIRDATTGKELFCLGGYNEDPEVDMLGHQGFSFTKDSKSMVVLSNDTAFEWFFHEGNKVQVLLDAKRHEHHGMGSEVNYLSDGRLVLVSGPYIYILSSKPEREIVARRKLMVHAGYGSQITIAIQPSEEHIAVGFTEKSIYFYDAKTLSPVNIQPFGEKEYRILERL